MYIVKDIDCDLGKKYRVKVVTTTEGSIIIHALTKQEADMCLKDIEDTINSTHVVTKVIPVSLSQAQYLEAKHKLQSKAEKNKVEFSLVTHQTNDCAVTLKGTINSVNAVMEILKCYIETEYNETLFDVQIDSKYVKMWFKHWQQLKTQKEAQQDVMIQFVQNHTNQNDPDTTYVSFKLWGDPKCIDPLKTFILTRDSGSCTRGKLTKLPKLCAPAIIKGLRDNEINIHSLAVEVEIDEISESMLIIAPLEVSDEDLKRAKEIILFHVDNQKQLFTLSDPVMALILASPKYSGQLYEIKQLYNVKVDAPKYPKNDLTITGNPPAIENVITALQKLQVSMIADIDQTTLLLDPQHVNVIESSGFVRFCETLQEQLFVCCSRGYRKTNTTIHSPVFIQPAPLSHCIKFEVVQGSLINENVYAIVNNANENLQHKDGVAKLIADAGGPSIHSDSYNYIASHGKLKTGEAVCLGGGSLLCRRVIHVVWPHWGLGGRRKEKDIGSTFSKVLNIAKAEKIESVSFSIFGSNIPPDVFAQALLNAINHFCKLDTGTKSHVQKVRCVLPDNSSIIDAFMSALYKCSQRLPNSPDFSSTIKLASNGENSTISRNIQSKSASILSSSEVTTKESSSKPGVLKIETTAADSWVWQDDNGTFIPFNVELCKVLSIEYAKNPSGNYSFTIGGYLYSIDFTTMTQTNKTTKKRRCVEKRSCLQQVPATTSLSLSIPAQQVGTEEANSTLDDDIHEDEIIHTMLLRGLKDNLENSKASILAMLESAAPSKSIPHSLSSNFFLTFPPEWQPQNKTTELFLLSPETAEWKHVAQLFQQSMPQSVCTILSVKRIQNKWLWERYFQHRKRLHVKNDGIVNEKELFHGTRTNEPRLIYESEDGFDMRYSAEGMWGRANYFAANASYSNSYAHTNASTGLKEMFLVKLLTGESYNCAPDSTLRVPPPKPKKVSSGLQIEQLKYDTVTGLTGGSQVYMAYDNEKAYPAYLIEYI